MGNGIAKQLCVCCHGGCRRYDKAAVLSDPLDEGLGHSFCYVRPDMCQISLSKVHSEEPPTTTTFRIISGASVSANTSTPLSTSCVDLYSYNSFDRAAAFESSNSFASIPLQPVPRFNFDSMGAGSGLIEKGFLSGPIERGFISGPLDPVMFSGNLEKVGELQRSFSHGGFAFGKRFKKKSLIQGLRKAISKKISMSFGTKNSIKGVVGKESGDWSNSSYVSSEGSCLEDEDSLESQNLQWAQGKAGEDRVHVVISEEHGWVFVGIYDGFNGPDATDFLLSNLYPAVQKELKGLLWDDSSYSTSNETTLEKDDAFPINEIDDEAVQSCSNSNYDENESYPRDLNMNSKKGRGKKTRNKYRGVSKKWEESQKRWKHEWDRERLELDQKLKEHLNHTAPTHGETVNHSEVMKALSEALRKTEEAYLDISDLMSMENPELALMGSCVLVMVMKGEDVYVMNVGDSRAVLAQKAEQDFLVGKPHRDLERIKEETLNDLLAIDGDDENEVDDLISVQLTKDHSTSIIEEVQRIRNEHPDDVSSISKDRVKGSLKVTRAFGAGFLKQPKLNNALLEMFRIDYVGTSPYISCLPSLCHHRLGPKDKFLILSSDGLYQYFTNEEAVSEVELFIASSPEGDPAQHLVEEVLFRAAKKAGMDFHELLEIPQGDRRRYHDDVSIIVISLEGRIWRSCV
ncbi:putative protein phosphatase 2C 4 [Ranunculus cassubicifolius]